MMVTTMTNCNERRNRLENHPFCLIFVFYRKNQSSLYDETRAEAYGSLDADTDLSGMKYSILFVWFFVAACSKFDFLDC